MTETPETLKAFAFAEAIYFTHRLELLNHASAWGADRKAMWAAYNLLERADHQYYDSEAEAILGAALRSEEEKP